MQISAPIYQLKRRAKQMSKAQNLPLHKTLDLVAGEEGFQAWSHLSACHETPNAAERILNALGAGEMLLLGARPGQGKTQMALDIAQRAAEQGAVTRFYTLDYTLSDVAGAG